MKRNLNILEVFSSASWGGGELYVFELSKRLIKDVDKLICIAKNTEIINSRLRKENIPFVNLPVSGVFDFFSAFKIRRLIKKENINLIHVHNFKTLFPIIYSTLFLREKPRIVVTRHLVGKAKTSLLYKWAYSKIDTLIFVSQLAKNEFFITKPNLNTDKVFVVHNSVEEAKKISITENYREKYLLSDDELVISFTGRLVYEKGIEHLILAFNNLRHIKLRLFIAGVGDEAYMQRLKRLVRENNLEDRVVFLGFIKDVHSLIAQTDIGVCPSVWREPFGLSIIEFMQRGIPVITTNNGAQKEYIQNNETGILINPDNVKAISSAIENLATNPELRAKLSENSLIYFKEKLSYNEFYRKVLDILSL